ncbi:hypothetical protein AB0368_26330 [Actinoplanes sp. NPDC051475]|uniref:hypothetical protein n=1 Tax=Actinoplanes sp. NPDC051475 TaxID=3157225 RepID=UPI00344EEE87
MNEVVFPRGTDGRRSSSELGRQVVADALRAADLAAAGAAAAERDWRKGYLRHFRALVEAGDGYAVAAAGLASVHERMRVEHDGDDVPLAEVFDADPAPLGTVTVAGDEKPERELTVPYRGETLRGDSLHRQLDRWVAAGTIEASCAEMVREVAANPG